jgi:four helix bundle protein
MEVKMAGITADKSYAFAIKIVKLYQYLVNDKNEFVLSRQLLRSGTSIGANVREGEDGQSRADFLSKFNIALKEANETLYWIDLLHDTDFLEDKEYELINVDCIELKKLLTSIVKTTRSK